MQPEQPDGMPGTLPSHIDLDGDVWRFACAFYGIASVSETCLRLQDKWGVDIVCLILVLYSHAVRERPLSAGDVTSLKASMKLWRQETVLPLRALRRRLKAPPAGFPAQETEALRSMIKKAELRAEQIQLAMGEQWLLRLPASGGPAIEEILPLLQETACGEEPEKFRSLMKPLLSAAHDTAASR